MAGPQENLLSLGHLTGTERITFTKQTQHSLKKSVNRPLLLQTNFSTHQHLRTMHLQRRWQELKERELTAQQHNRQLLQQFGEAQDTLREMLTLTAAMKTIRTEYERYLEESTPRWQQQLREKTKAAQRKQFTRKEDYLRSYLENADERVTKPSTDQPLPSRGLTAKPQTHYSRNSHLDYNQDGSPHVPYMQPPWQTHPQPQTARFPFTIPYQPQGSSHVPSSFLPPPIIPPPHPLQLHPLTSTPINCHPWPRQNPPSWSSLQADCPWSWTGGAAGIPSGSEALWGQLYREEPPLEEQVLGEEPDTSRAPSSRRERGGGRRSSHLSQELDIKPVRLSSWPAESGESSRESSQASRERRKKREKKGRSRRTSSNRERCSSQESSSSAIITAAVTEAGGPESDTSSEKSRISTSRRMRGSGGLDAGSPKAEKVVKERTRSEAEDSGSHKDGSPSQELGSPVEGSRCKKHGDQSPDDKSQSCREELESQREEESGSVSIKIENGAGDETEKQERSSSDETSAGEKGEEDGKLEKDLGGGGGEEDQGDDEEREDSQSDEEQERDVDDDDVSERKTTTEEEEGTGAEESSGEKSDRMKDEDAEDGKQSFSSSRDEERDEDESERGEDKLEKEGESEEEEDGAAEEEKERRDKVGEPEEERDSDDSIILPQNKSKKMQVIPEEGSEAEDGDEEEKGNKTGSSDNNSDELSDEDDVEHLLAPQLQSQKKEEELRADEKQKAICEKVEIFQVDKPAKSGHLSDSDEFDHFYD